MTIRVRSSGYGVDPLAVAARWGAVDDGSGSSIEQRDGRGGSVRAMARRWRSPPESITPSPHRLRHPAPFRCAPAPPGEIHIVHPDALFVPSISRRSEGELSRGSRPGAGIPAPCPIWAEGCRDLARGCPTPPPSRTTPWDHVEAAPMARIVLLACRRRRVRPGGQLRWPRRARRRRETVENSEILGSTTIGGHGIIPGSGHCRLHWRRRVVPGR
jgi:hypothetical protein